MKKLIISAVLIVLVVFALTSCDFSFDGIKDIFSKDTEEVVTSKTPETTKAPETTKTPETTTPQGIDTPSISEHTHSYRDTVVAPTCSIGGYTVHTCSCGDTYKDNETAATGKHTYGDWITILEASCTTKGEQKRLCSACGAADSRETALNPDAHSYVEKTRTSPTTTKAGEIVYECAYCHKTKTEINGYATGSVGLTIVDGVITGIGDCVDTEITIYSTDSTGKPITGIASGAFKNSSITKINIPAGITKIGNGAFAGCSNLLEIKVDADNAAYKSENGTLYSKDGKVLVACPAGKYVSDGVYNIAQGVEEIAPGAFAGCTYIKTFTLASSMSHYMVIDDVLYKSNNDIVTSAEVETETSSTVPVITLVAYPAGGRKDDAYKRDYVSDPSKAGEFGKNKDAYGNEINVTGEVFTYNSYFNRFDYLTYEDISSNKLRVVIDDYAFYGAIKLCGVDLPTDFRYTDADKEAKKIMPELYIGESAFENCVNLVGIVLPEGITEIKDYAFCGCTALSEIMIPDTVERIGVRAFMNCRSLATVVLGTDVDDATRSAVEKFGKEAFYYCTSLKNLFYKGDSYTWSDISHGSEGSWYNLEIYLNNNFGNEVYFYSTAQSFELNHSWRFDKYGNVFTRWSVNDLY